MFNSSFSKTEIRRKKTSLLKSGIIKKETFPSTSFTTQQQQIPNSSLLQKPLVISERNHYFGAKYSRVRGDAPSWSRVVGGFGGASLRADLNAESRISQQAMVGHDGHRPPEDASKCFFRMQTHIFAPSFLNASFEPLP